MAVSRERCNRREDIFMTIPNLLTLARITLVPGFLIGVIYGYWQLSLGIFMLAAVTDVLDGFLARCLNQESRLGLYLDPLADKLLNTVAYLSLAIAGLLPAWLAVVVLFKDLFIGLGVAILYLGVKKLETLPSAWGKSTTFLQAIAVAAALLWKVQDRAAPSLDVVYWFTGAMTVFSCAHYILRGVRQVDEGAKLRAPV